MDNIEIAKVLNKIADILEIKGEDRFRIGAYRKVAQVIEAMPEDINEIYKLNKLEEIPGVGESIAKKIKELIEKGKLKALRDLEKKVPSGVVEMMEVEGIGPKLASLVWKKFKIKNLYKLEKLLRKGGFRRLHGFGEKREANILRGIELFKKQGERFLIGKVDPRAKTIVERLKASGLCQKIEVAGSLRRRRETIGDIDILATSKKPNKVMDIFCQMPEVKEVEAKGRTKSVVILKSGIEADLRAVKPESFGAALQYFTGSKAHNIRLRQRAIERGLKINEYGVFKKIQNPKSKIQKLKRIGGKTEEEIYQAVDLPWMPPEIREDRGEIEAAEKGILPKLVDLKDIKADLHLHSLWSDGANTIEEIIKAAILKRYEYVAITDHASPLGIIKGIAGGRVIEQLKEINSLRKKYSNKIKILAGAEVDILPNGKLYLPDEILKKLDLVIAAVHSSFKMSEEEMTERILKAIRSPYVNLIAHPTGRILGRREAYFIDLKRIFQECKKYNVFLELNAFWNRLDLNDINLRKAKEAEVKIAISTDAHNLMELEIMKYGLDQAKRGWLEKKDVLNCLSFEKFSIQIARYKRAHPNK